MRTTSPSILFDQTEMTAPNPYESPTPLSDAHGDSVTGFRRLRLISGVVILLAMVTGAMGTVIGMMFAFSELGEGKSVDVNQLAGHISSSLTFGMFAIFVAIVAFGFWLWATLRLRRAGDLKPRRKRPALWDETSE